MRIQPQVHDNQFERECFQDYKSFQKEYFHNGKSFQKEYFHNGKSFDRTDIRTMSFF